MIRGWPGLSGSSAIKPMHLALRMMVIGCLHNGDRRLAFEEQPFALFKYQSCGAVPIHYARFFVVCRGLQEQPRKMKHGCFSVTSNIDGHWERTEGIGEKKVYECHGALTRMQCVEDDGKIWRTDPDQMAKIEVPEWDLAPGEKVLVRFSSGEAEAVVQEDGCSLEVDGRPIAAKAVFRKGGPDLLRALPKSLLPLSADNKPARPNVLMFGDWGVNCDLISEQGQAFNAWMKEVPMDANLVVVEVGAGKAVPTIRNHSERVLALRDKATLIRINWDDSDVPRGLRERSISIGGIGALDVLTQLDKLLGRTSL